MKDAAQNVAFLNQMMSCVYENLYSWQYDEKLHLSQSSCPHESILHSLFVGSGCMDYLTEYARDNTVPLLLSSPIGLIWLAAFEYKEHELKRVYLMGPAVINDSSAESIRLAQQVMSSMNFSLAAQQQLKQVIEHLPVISHVNLSQMAPMLHYCVTKRKLGISDINSQHKIPLPDQFETLPERDRYQAWRAGQILMRAVREGDMNYRQILNSVSGISTGVSLQSNENLRQVKDTAIVFSSMCAIAAIDGGLSPETAYTVGDGYIQGIENAQTFSEIVALDNTMYSDFVHRVHKAKSDSALSKQVQKCCDYIHQHLEDDLSLNTLSRQVGYSQYYLSRKFAKETGTNLTDYIRSSRIDFSKHLLIVTNDTIQQIADRLRFSSRSHFTSVFRQLTGSTPIEYRKQNQRI